MTGVRVTSLGLFILDTFEWRTASGDLISTKETAVGGGGTYAILGSRVLSVGLSQAVQVAANREEFGYSFLNCLACQLVRLDYW